MWLAVEVMSYYAYILASRKNGAIYIGITMTSFVGFTSTNQGCPRIYLKIQYHAACLVRSVRRPDAAIFREKELKKCKRAWNWSRRKIWTGTICPSRSVVRFVIPGWSEGPYPESRDSGFASIGAAPCADPLDAPRNDGENYAVAALSSRSAAALASAVISARPACGRFLRGGDRRRAR